MLIYIILATLAVSILSLLGIFFMHKRFEKLIHYLISFAAGAFISVAVFDLLPEALEHFEELGDHNAAFIFLAVGIVLFFLIERFVHWHHCGKHECHRKTLGPMSLVGDILHNFLDGIIIAGAFLVDIGTGIATTIGIALHEIPQELGDFSVLVHSGFSKKKALKLNFLVALSAVIGGVIGFVAFSVVEALIPYILAIAAGGFLYIALSDIVPELHEHKNRVISKEALIFVLSIVFFYFLLGALQHAH